MRKTNLDNLDLVERTETKTMGKLIQEEPKAPTQTSPSLSPQIEVEKKKEESAALPPRKKQITKKSKTPLPATLDHYPLVSDKVKTTFSEILQREATYIKERALDLKSYKADKVIMDIIKNLAWTTFYGKRDVGILQPVREFHANLEEEDRVFV